MSLVPSELHPDAVSLGVPGVGFLVVSGDAPPGFHCLGGLSVAPKVMGEP